MDGGATGCIVIRTVFIPFLFLFVLIGFRTILCSLPVIMTGLLVGANFKFLYKITSLETISLYYLEINLLLRWN